MAASSLKVVVYGAGGVGGFYGAELLRAGCDVQFLARGSHLKALQEKGLTIERDWPGGETEHFDIKAVAAPGELAAFDPDIILLCVKYNDLAAAAKGCNEISARAGVVTVQNGVDAVDILAAEVARERVIGGTANIVAFIKEPGTLLLQSEKPRIEIGELEGKPDSARVNELADCLRSVDQMVAVSSDIRKTLWTKFVFMGSLGAVCAATRASIKEVVGIPETTELLTNAMREVMEVAKMEGVTVPGEPENFVKRLQSSPLHPEASVSTARDIAEGKPTELDFLTGKLVSIADKHGKTVPTLKVLYATLLPQHLKGQRSVTSHAVQAP